MPGQRRAQPAPARAARDEPRGPELPVHAATAASRSVRTCGSEALAVFETPHRHAVRLQPARRGRRAHAGARRDGQRQELPAELPDHARAEVRPAHGRPRSRAQLPQAGDAARRAATSSSGLRQHDVTINPFALEPTPEHLHFLHAFVRVLLEGEDGYRLSDARGPRGLRGGREPLRPRPQPAAALHAGEPAAARARRRGCTSGSRAVATRALFDNLEDTLTVERLQVFDFEAMRAYPVAARAAAVLRAAPRRRARPGPGGGAAR